VINRNLSPILHRFQVTADYVQYSLATGERYTSNALAWDDALRISP